MKVQNLYIKNMVCDRCRFVVQKGFLDLGIEPLSVRLGEVTLQNPLNQEQASKVVAMLESYGFALIDDRKIRLIEQVKNLIIDLIYNANSELKINLSDYLVKHIHYDYNYISSLFSEVEDTTIGKYFIAQKIERVKELLAYDELTLNEIAFQLNYSSVAHLSSQFKKVTGFTPSHFKQIKENKRKPLDKV